MSLKILGGALKGLGLLVNDKVTRPTGVLLKRKIFDARQSFVGVHFIDLCAGSGSVGFEALSRGAESLVLVENNFDSIKNIKKAVENIKSRDCDNLNHHSIEVVRKSAQSWLKHSHLGSRQDNVIMFFDPPYDDHKLYFEVLNFVNDSGFSGDLWVEYDLKGSKAIIDRMMLEFETRGIKKYTHGQHEIAILQFL
jgi:16S rRNA (guanine966-N2)-methyltransferase